MMRKVLILLLIVFVTASCSAGEKDSKGRSVQDYSRFEICYDGVVYIKATRMMAAKFNADGTVATCDG